MNQPVILHSLVDSSHVIGYVEIIFSRIFCRYAGTFIMFSTSKMTLFIFILTDFERKRIEKIRNHFHHYLIIIINFCPKDTFKFTAKLHASHLELNPWKKYENSLKMYEKLMNKDENFWNILHLYEYDWIFMRTHEKVGNNSETLLKLRNYTNNHTEIFRLFQAYSKITLNKIPGEFSWNID